jgi:hypothetical protein
MFVPVISVLVYGGLRFQPFALGIPELYVLFATAEAADPSETRHFQPSPRENGRHSGVTPELQSENPGFSTFFSTVVENFGGRPYGCRGRPYGCRREGTLT